MSTNEFDTRFFKKRLIRPQSPYIHSSALDQSDNQDNQDESDSQIENPIASKINSILDPHIESAVSSRLKDLLSQYPTPEQHAPSKKRRALGAIAGGLVGATNPEQGYKLSSEIVENPYKNAMQNWETKYKPAEAAYNLETSANKNNISGLSDIASYMRAMNESNPDLQGQIERAKIGAREGVEQPNRIQLRNLEGQQASSLEDKRLGGQIQVHNITQENENLRTAAGIKGRASEGNLDRQGRLDIAKMDDATRRYIADKERELRREIAKDKTGSNLSVDQQVKARMDAEDQILGSTMPDLQKGLPGITPEEFDALVNDIKDSNGKHVAWALKSEKDVPSEWKGAYLTRKAQIQRKANKMLSTTISDVSGEDEWEGGLLTVKP